MRALALQYRKAHDQKQQELKDMLTRVEAAFDVDELLADRQMLKQLAEWIPVPHSCGAVSAKHTALAACKDVAEGQIMKLAEQWLRRHLGIPARDPPEVAGNPCRMPPQRLCLTEGVCVCRGQNRLRAFFWVAARRVLMEQYSHEIEKLQLTGGTACLLWRGRAGAETDIAATVMLYVPLHCGKPWRAVFLALAFATPEDERLSRSPGLGQDGEPFIHFRLLEGDCGFTFQNPLQMVAGLDLDFQWEVAFLVLSDRVVRQGSRDTFTAQLRGGRPLHVWDGADREWHKRRRQRPRQAAAAADDDGGSGGQDEDFFNAPLEESEVQDYEAADQSDADDQERRGDLGAQVQALIEEADLSENDRAVAEPLPSNSNNSQCNAADSSSSSSSSSSDDDVLVVMEEEAISEAAAGAAAAAVAGEQQGASRALEAPARQRALRPQSFTWGNYFHFSFRPAVDNGGRMMMAYHVVCRFHRKIGAASCSKQLSFEPQEHDDAVKRLKLWALSAQDHATKLEHQGRRGLPVLSEGDAERSHEWLDRQVALMPEPPQ